MSINSAERFLFEQSLHHPRVFRNAIRPWLYRRNGKDPELVHGDVLERANDPDILDILKDNQHLFRVPDYMKVVIRGRVISPFGSSAGMDKDGRALRPFSYVFGFQEPGTVVVNERRGNKPPRVVADDRNLDMYNAQGFPSKGLENFVPNIVLLRYEMGDDPTIYVSICGLPEDEHNAINVANGEMRILMKALDPYVNGYVWNCFSPNSEVLVKLRTPQVTRDTSKLMSDIAPDKLRMMKMGPYEDNDDERERYLELVNAFIEGGGHGVICVNTKMFPRDQVPAKNWGYKSAGRSGAYLRDHRLRAVSDTRRNFPGAVIFATGGIYKGDDAYKTLQVGANALMGYTPYTFFGLGLLRQLQTEVGRRIRNAGWKNMRQFQEAYSSDPMRV